jgi:multidrug efflux pump subunit AcrA (membrane-fusion protein)
LLFQIDPRPYQHVYDQAVGQLQQAQANQQLQEVTFERQQRLRETGVIAKEDYDTALSNKSQSSAQVISVENMLYMSSVSAADGNIKIRYRSEHRSSHGELP